MLLFNNSYFIISSRRGKATTKVKNTTTYSNKGPGLVSFS